MSVAEVIQMRCAGIDKQKQTYVENQVQASDDTSTTRKSQRQKKGNTDPNYVYNAEQPTAVSQNKLDLSAKSSLSLTQKKKISETDMIEQIKKDRVKYDVTSEINLILMFNLLLHILVESSWRKRK